MKRKMFGLVVLGLAVLAACGGRGVYLYENKGNPYGGPDRPWLIIGAKGAGSSQLEKRLCQDRELESILSEARVPPKSLKELFLAACGPRASAERFLEIYYALPDPVRARVKRSFERHGYSLNDYGC